MSLRDAIFSAQDIPHEIVMVPEWNVKVEVRGMTGLDRTRILDAAMSTQGQLNLQMVYPQIVVACSHDPETGEKIFELSDIDALLSKSAVAIDRVAMVGMRLSGFTEEAQAQAGKQFPEETA